MVVVEGAAVRLLSRRSTMLAIVLGVFGLGFCCWLLFTPPSMRFPSLPD